LINLLTTITSLREIDRIYAYNSLKHFFTLSYSTTNSDRPRM